ncbi:MAG: DUF2236 domain-containing protein [Chloroflexota bacterium]|nr:DUF2236 domain-containing protein [Chloroflexota bacterium]
MTTKTTSTSYHSLPPEILEEIREDDERFERCLEYVRDHAAGEVEGVTGPGSMSWHIFREPGILLGGLRAILLQIAHPAVAAGVEQSSSFRNDVLGRAERTYTAMYELVFGTLHEAIGAAKRLHNIHNQVRGTVESETDSPWAGRYYRANDPTLLLWVWATLIDTTILVYERFLNPLTRQEKVQYYRESRIGATLMGVPPEMVPPTLDRFYDYYHGMLEGQELAVGDVAREQADVLFSAPYTPIQFDRILTGGILPPRFRDAYGLSWGEKEQARHRDLWSFLHLVTQLIPDTLRVVPAYHQARLRVALAQGKKPYLLARVVNRIDHWVNVPLSIKPIPVSSGK